jgi:hypothetical protein
MQFSGRRKNIFSFWSVKITQEAIFNQKNVSFEKLFEQFFGGLILGIHSDKCLILI